MSNALLAAGEATQRGHWTPPFVTRGGRGPPSLASLEAVLRWRGSLGVLSGGVACVTSCLELVGSVVFSFKVTAMLSEILRIAGTLDQFLVTSLGVGSCPSSCHRSNRDAVQGGGLR